MSRRSKQGLNNLQRLADHSMEAVRMASTILLKTEQSSVRAEEALSKTVGISVNFIRMLLKNLPYFITYIYVH